jgi:hypothetical protein
LAKITHSCDCLSNYFLGGFKLDLANEDSKWVLFRLLFAKTALFLFIHAILVMVVRIFSKKSSPATQEDPTSIKLLNRILGNSVEQTLIFAGLYAYFLFDVSGTYYFI